VAIGDLRLELSLYLAAQSIMISALSKISSSNQTFDSKLRFDLGKSLCEDRSKFFSLIVDFQNKVY
jgi:hypothetical protein